MNKEIGYMCKLPLLSAHIPAVLTDLLLALAD